MRYYSQMMEAQTMMPLKENYQDFFTLVYKGKNGSNREITINLPNADYKNVRRVTTENGDKMYSDHYIYL